MHPLWCLFAVQVVSVSLLTEVGRADEIGDYLAKDGKLTKKLVFSDALATLTSWHGYRCEVEPSGDWASYWSRIPEPAARGKLTSKELSALCQTLALHNFSKLPKTMGYKRTGEPAKPREVVKLVSIRFGDKETLFFRGASKYEYLAEPGSAEASEWLRFVSIELLLRDLIKYDAPKQESK